MTTRRTLTTGICTKPREFRFQCTQGVKFFLRPVSDMSAKNLDSTAHNRHFAALEGGKCTLVKQVKNAGYLFPVLNLPNQLSLICVGSAVATADHLAAFVGVDVPAKSLNKMFQDGTRILPLDNAGTNTNHSLGAKTVIFHFATGKAALRAHLLLPDVDHEITFAPKETGKLSHPKRIHMAPLCGW